MLSKKSVLSIIVEERIAQMDECRRKYDKGKIIARYHLTISSGAHRFECCLPAWRSNASSETLPRSERSVGQL